MTKKPMQTFSFHKLNHSYKKLSSPYDTKDKTTSTKGITLSGIKCNSCSTSPRASTSRNSVCFFLPLMCSSFLGLAAKKDRHRYRHWRCLAAVTNSVTLVVSVYQMPADITGEKLFSSSTFSQAKVVLCRHFVCVFMLNICKSLLAFPALASHL